MCSAANQAETPGPEFDPVLHNVHPTPTVAGNKESNMAQLPKSKDLEFVFNNPEIFPAL